MCGPTGPLEMRREWEKIQICQDRHPDVNRLYLSDIKVQKPEDTLSVRHRSLNQLRRR
jgi:hypothetical protein